MKKFGQGFGITSGTSNYNFGFGYTTDDSDNDRYPDLLEMIKERFNAIVATGVKLFTTNSQFLYATYLDQMPAYARQHYVCRSCEQFIENFGGLVIITDTGKTRSALWDANCVPPFFRKSVQTMQAIVEAAPVNGVFQAEYATLGTPKTGSWEHLSVTVPKSYVNQSRIQSAFQWMAEKKEEYKTLMNAISKFQFKTVEEALNIIRHGNLSRVEKVSGIGEWFYELRVRLNSTKGVQAKNNIVWAAVAGAPTGFCHIPASNYGAMLTDIQEGLTFDKVKAKHAERTNPLVYQRPQAAPKAGNIARAEQIVGALKSEGALTRRFARLEELNLLWKPQARKKEVRDGVFGHLYQDGSSKVKSVVNNPVTMTWEKFARTVLPYAKEIEYLVTGGNKSYAAILTATTPFAPPILQWDTEERRNPFSWYVYGHGSDNIDWGLPKGYVKVTGITLQPSMWYAENAHQGKAVHFILDGAKDRRYRGAGNAIFPETLKAEYREIRSTIEAYSKGELIQGGAFASANGIRLQDGHNWDAQFRVTTDTGTAVYKLDRWD